MNVFKFIDDHPHPKVKSLRILKTKRMAQNFRWRTAVWPVDISSDVLALGWLEIQWLNKWGLEELVYILGKFFHFI